MKNPLALLIGLALLLPCLVGCSVVRTAGMAAVGLANSPVPPEGKRESFEPQGYVCDNAKPQLCTAIRVQKPMAEVAAFYRQDLVKRGWHETKSNEDQISMD